MFDYAQLEALLEIEREGSIDGAARSLGISSSAISQRIKVLEERLGGVSVSRQKPAVPTEFGRLLCRHAEKVIFLEQDLIAKNSSHFSKMSKTTNTVKVAIDQTTASTWFIDVISAEAERSRAIIYDITIVENSMATLMMKQGEALAAVSNMRTPIQGFTSKSLGMQLFKAAMTPAFAKSHFKDGVDAQTIQQCATIKRSAHDDLYRQWISQTFGFELELSAHIIPSAQGIQDAVLKDIAWAMLPAETAKPFLERGQLVELVPGQSLHRSVYWHFSRSIAGALQPLTQTVEKVAAAKLGQPIHKVVQSYVRKPGAKR